MAGSGVVLSRAAHRGRRRSRPPWESNPSPSALCEKSFPVRPAPPLRSAADVRGGSNTPEHLVFRWSPSGYTLDVRPGEPPSQGGSVSDGAQSYRVTKVASSPLPADSRPCAYLLPGTVNGNGPPDALAPVWTKPDDEIAVLAGAFPAGTCVVAVDAEGRRLGLTVDSLVCLSLEPPLVGFAVEEDCPLLELMQDAGGCAISILAGGQMWLADHFAGGARPIAMWHGLASEPGAVGAPLFVGALGWLECSLLDVVEIGTQALFVLAVRRAETGSEAPALVRVRGAYQTA